MSLISSFTDEEAEAIVSLPYRAGLNVSYAEDEDGERDDVLEMQALQDCIEAFVNQHEGEDLTRDIAQEVLNSKDKWEQWSQGVFNIEPLCEKAVLSLKSKASEAEVKSYIKMVVAVSTAVAQAYGEFGEGVEPEKGFFGKALGKIVGGLSSGTSEDVSHPMNVSAAEDSAISTIVTALKKHI